MAQDDSRIEQLKKKLYSQTEEPPKQHRGRLHPHAPVVNNSWVGDQEIPKVEYGKDDEYTGFGAGFKKVLIGAVAFFVLAASASSYIFYNGSNVVSPDKIDIKMLGPVASPAGEVLSVDIDIRNDNNSELILADLVVTYPEGTREEGDGVTSLVTDRVPVGTIKSGQTIRKTVKSILFGEENVKKNIKVTLEYRVPGSDSIFTKTKDYPIFIGSSPVTLTVDTLREVTANQVSTFKVTLVSNSTSIIKGLLLKVDYPFGFKYFKATPDPLSGTDTWSLGDLEPGGRREITIVGTIIGQNKDERVFNFSAGTEDPQNTTVIKSVFVSTSASIAVREPFLGADISLNGNGADVVVVDAGEAIGGEITWQNNLDVPVNDVILEAKITGAMLDKRVVTGDEGFYRSIDSTILWDRTTLKDLKEIAPGGVGRIQFGFASLPASIQNNMTFRRPEISLELTIRAKRLNENRVPEEITSTVIRRIKIQSGLVMNTRLVRTAGPFVNTGPLPPVVDQDSTYTVLVSVSNSFNTVKDGVFTTTLPSYVKWLGVIDPVTPGVVYNADKREITWPIGEIGAGTGYNSSAKEFAFQISFQPSISQFGQSPIIVNSQRVAGKDNFTDTIVENIQASLDAQIETDPAYKYGQDKVVNQ
ncbi:MAG: hypothetical protein V4664_02965 [Patescibacteria group bacterium]